MSLSLILVALTLVFTLGVIVGSVTEWIKTSFGFYTGVAGIFLLVVATMIAISAGL